MTIARFLRMFDVGEFRGDARLYELDPPEDDLTHVIVSGVNVGFGEGEETYIFPADEAGTILSWGELDGSFKGSIDHRRALEGAGWEVQE